MQEAAIKTAAPLLGRFLPVVQRVSVGQLPPSVGENQRVSQQYRLRASACCQGTCKVNDTIELPALKVTKQVKSMQMFRKPVMAVSQGDRAALCVTQFNAKLIERGLAAAPGTVPTFTAAVASVDKVRFYAGPVPGKAKYHMSIGHATVMAEAQIFGLPDAAGTSQAGEHGCSVFVAVRTILCAGLRGTKAGMQV